MVQSRNPYITSRRWVKSMGSGPIGSTAGGKLMARQNEKEGKRPGVLIYFDIRPALEMLTLSERGELFTAILAFAEDGEIPTFAGSLGMAWAFIRPQLEADAKRYRKTVVQNTYSSYCAKEKRAERKPMDFELWLEYEGIDANWNRVVPNDTERNPNSEYSPLQSTIENKRGNTASHCIA